MPNEPGPYVNIETGGFPLTPADLPSTNATRWVQRRKAMVVAAIEAGLLSLEDAGRRYNLSTEEITAWRLAFTEFGPKGLFTTKTQHYRTLRTRRK